MEVSSDQSRGFFAYTSWLVSLSWKRFSVLSGLWLIAALVLEELPPFSYTDSITDLTWLIILVSAILKITCKRTIQAEVKAAMATETAESEQLRREVVEARLSALQAQVEPYFLFSTLASIDRLIETDPPRASKMQKNLISLLRTSMPSSSKDTEPAQHTLGREIALMRPYLELLKTRMQDRLQTTLEVPNGLLSAEFPPLLIQSLVEKAIKNCPEPEPAPAGGPLVILAEVVDGQLTVSVNYTSIGIGEADTAANGSDLAAIRQRLELLYGDKASIDVADHEPCGTVVFLLSMPYLPLSANETSRHVALRRPDPH